MSRLRTGRSHPGVWVAVALVLGVLAALATAQAGAREDAGAPVLVARERIPAGTLLDPDRAARSLGIATVSSRVLLPGMLDGPAAAAGRRTVAPLAPGEPVTQAVLGGGPGSGPDPLRPGERAVAVPLGAAGAAAPGIVAGTRVDVVAVEGEGPAGRTSVVVPAAEVLEVSDSGLAADSPPVAGASVLLRVSARQALRVTAALNFAREVRLLLRPASEAAEGAP